MKREFFLRERSNKFWTVECIGADLVTTNGRIGAKPRETRSAHPSEQAARAAAEKQIRGKLDKGYKEGRIEGLPPYVETDWSAMTMSEDVFWHVLSLLDWRKKGDDDAVLRPAVRALAAMRETEIFRFDDLMAEKLFALDTREHARYCYEGEANPDDGNDYISPDDFLYGRCAVLTNGRALFERVIAEPREIPRQVEFESLLSLPSEAYEAKTGKPYEHTSPVSYESFSNVEGWKPTSRTEPGAYTAQHIPQGNRRPT